MRKRAAGVLLVAALGCSKASSGGGPSPSTVRSVPFDGGVAKVESDSRGAEHVLLLAPDGEVVGESWCVAPLSGYDAVRRFFTGVRSAVLDGDADRIADLMAYPLRVNEPVTRLVASREQFIAERGRILTSEVVERIRAADPGMVSCSEQGHALGDGVLWAELQPNERLAVWAVNVGPGPRRRPGG